MITGPKHLHKKSNEQVEDCFLTFQELEHECRKMNFRTFHNGIIIIIIITLLSADSC